MACQTIVFGGVAMKDDVSSAGNLAVVLNGDYLCAACSCGQASLVSVDYSLDHGSIACHCGAQVSVDEALITQLTNEERLRLERRAAKLSSASSD